jgi:hypothetical protein
VKEEEEKKEPKTRTSDSVKHNPRETNLFIWLWWSISTSGLQQTGKIKSYCQFHQIKDFKARNGEFNLIEIFPILTTAVLLSELYFDT